LIKKLKYQKTLNNLVIDLVVVYQEVVLLMVENESKVLIGYTKGPVTTSVIFEAGITCVGVVTVVSVFSKTLKTTRRTNPKPIELFS
jgi:hypothetical protein